VTPEIIRLALEEDIGSGDVTSRACVPEDRLAGGRFLAREPMTVAGLDLLEAIYQQRGGVDQLTLLKHNGDRCQPNDVLATVRGRARTLLECERVALNFLQRLSGVATAARSFADAVAGTNCRVLDTRKTTPGLRALEKAAAAAGGVTNHRMGLFDAVLIKNNHISAAGGVRQAITNARRAGLPIEIEVRTREELREALDCRADHLLLDNLTPGDAREWIREIAGRARVELSGGIHLGNVRAYAETGADFVSSGTITHSARAMDISFRLELDAPRIDVEQVRAEFPDRRIVHFPTIDSTMRAAAGMEAGAVVLADEQTAGQGRHGHAWHSEAAAGIYCSIVLKPAPLLTLALGLAAADAITQSTGAVCDLRWPNDVLIGSRKVAGVLVQLIDGAAIAGIGINVNHTAFPETLANEATSLRMILGREIDPTALLGALVRAVDSFTAEPPESILQLFRHASSYAAGRRVTVFLPDGMIHGTTAGLTSEGFLTVRKDDGTDTLVIAGGVRAAGS
jgi:nicotinate-nucleotide pyrophosphorylase